MKRSLGIGRRPNEGRKQLDAAGGIANEQSDVSPPERSGAKGPPRATA